MAFTSLNINSGKFIADKIKAATMPRAKNNKFMVRLTTPSGVDDMSGYEFLCDGVDFPFHTFTTENEFYALKHNKSVSGIDYDPITLSFNIDSGLIFGKNRAMNMFLDWSKLIKPDSGLYGYLEEYSGTVEVDFLNDALSVIKTAVMYKSFPINGDNIALQSEDDSLSSINVTFEYEKITYLDYGVASLIDAAKDRFSF